jgi:cation:H+ antiporter
MLEYILFIIGIAFLIKGAGFLVDGASSLAKKLGVPTLMIGLTVVAFGTSMPELIVNLIAAANGASQVAFGNVIGSNIANILLVLGITAMIVQVKVHHSIVWKDIPFALLAVFVLFVVSNKFMIGGIDTFSLTRIDGIVLLLFFAIFIYYVVEMALRNKSQLTDEKMAVHQMRYYKIALYLVLGVVGLYLGGKWVVEGAVFIATQIGISQFLISATIVAIGTSLPELITSVVAARKKDVDLAVGNIVGSNLFNIFWILGITSIISPVPIPSFINVDIIILLIASFLLFIFMFVGKKHHLNRWNGYTFVLLYIAYIVFLILRG